MTMGVYPAAVTPFDEKGDIDFSAFVKLFAWFKAGGCKGVVLAGTNGEGPSLSAVEKRDLVRQASALSDGLEVVLGVATPSLTEAQWLCKQAYSAGASTVLLMPPSYFTSASQDGIALWFEAVLDRSPLPVLIYNFPQRTGITLQPELMARLARHEKMLGLKDSSGNAANIQAYAHAVAGLGKQLFVGDETLLWDALQNGWTGTISGASNLIPSWLSIVVSEWQTDRESAETKFQWILPVLKAIRACPQPSANKKMLETIGILPSADVRLPLEPASEAQVEDAIVKIKNLIR